MIAKKIILINQVLGKFFFADFFATFFVQNKDCKENLNFDKTNPFASSFAKPFAENQTCKENANVIYHSLSQYFFANPFAKPFAESQRYKDKNIVWESLGWS